MIKTPRDGNRITLFRLIAFWTVLLSALLTAGDDFSLPTAPGRLIYWIAHIGSGLVLVSFVTLWLQRIWMSRFGEWTQLALSSIVAVVVFAPLGIILDLLIPDSFGPDGHGDLDTDVETQGPIAAAVDEIGAYAPTVVVVWLIVHLSYRFLSNLSADTTTDVDEPQPENTATEDSILQKLPRALGHDVVLIRSDANYVHVHTVTAKTMFLYSLAKAAEELQDRGFLVHRSYWIAFDHVQAVTRNGERMSCLMSDGTSVPVSRRRQKSVVAQFGNNFVRPVSDR